MKYVLGITPFILDNFFFVCMSQPDGSDAV